MSIMDQDFLKYVLDNIGFMTLIEEDGIYSAMVMNEKDDGTLSDTRYTGASIDELFMAIIKDIIIEK